MNPIEVRVVIDTNILFMAFYDENSNASKIIQLAKENKIALFSPDTVRNEFFEVIKRHNLFSEEETKNLIPSLPIFWIEKEIYEQFLPNTKVQHKTDKPIEALSIALCCRILSADKDFKNRLSVNELLKEINNKPN